MSYIKEYLHLKKVSEGDITENDDTSQNDEQPAEDIPEDQDMDADQKKDPPLHVTAVKEVSMIYASKYINYGFVCRYNIYDLKLVSFKSASK